MSILRQMLETHPIQPSMPMDDLHRALESLTICAQTCVMCADACLAEDQADHLRACIRLNLDCADVCQATLRCLGRQTETNSALLRSLLQTCVLTCRACREECQKHSPQHAHCRVCAQACHDCETICQSLIGGSSEQAQAA